MTITEEMIERADKVLHPGWYEEDACHCVQCAEEHNEELSQTRAALEAFLQGYRLQSAPIVRNVNEPEERVALSDAIENE